MQGSISLPARFVMNNVVSKIDSNIRVALVTGATGFIGKNLVSRLVREGWQVHIVTRKGSHLPPSLEFARVTNHTHDGTTEGMIHLVGEAKPNVVFHLASLFLAQHESKDIEPLILSNILFGSQLLEAMKVNDVRHIVNTGTSWQHYDNQDYSPVCLYAATKQAFDDILSYYTETTPIKAVTLQLFDSYGPNDPRPKLFKLLAKAAKSREVLAMSPGEQLIDLVYIDDVIDAYLCATDLLSNLPSGHHIFSVSSGEPIPLRELVAIYEKVVGTKLCIDWGMRPYRPREVMRTWDKGKSVAGWHPKVSLFDGIRRSI